MAAAIARTLVSRATVGDTVMNRECISIPQKDVVRVGRPRSDLAQLKTKPKNVARIRNRRPSKKASSGDVAAWSISST
jgi:hypothetical protein